MARDCPLCHAPSSMLEILANGDLFCNCCSRATSVRDRAATAEEQNHDLRNEVLELTERNRQLESMQSASRDERDE